MPKTEDTVIPACLPKAFPCRGANPLRILLKLPANRKLRRYYSHRQPAAIDLIPNTRYLCMFSRPCPSKARLIPWSGDASKKRI